MLLPHLYTTNKFIAPLHETVNYYCITADNTLVLFLNVMKYQILELGIAHTGASGALVWASLF